MCTPSAPRLLAAAPSASRSRATSCAWLNVFTRLATSNCCGPHDTKSEATSPPPKAAATSSSPAAGPIPAGSCRKSLHLGNLVALGSGGFFQDRKSTRLNSSHANISYAVFCLKKKHKLIHLYFI